MKIGIYFFYLTAFLISCDIINPDETIPSHLNIDNVVLTTTDIQGAATQNISDVWVTSKGDDLGVFPLPATIPVLSSGETGFTILFGIRTNGVNSLGQPYFFYNPTIQTFDLTEGATLNIDLATEYTATTNFSFVEGFEGSSTIFSVDLDDDSSTTLNITDDVALTGSSSGMILLTEENPVVQVATRGLSTDVINGVRNVFLEMDYKNEIEFIVLLLTQSISGALSTEEIITLRARDDWNKVYLDISRILGRTDLAGIQISLFADLFDVSQATIYVDNIKLIYE